MIILQITIVIICLLLAGKYNALMDHAEERGIKTSEWRNKWKDSDLPYNPLISSTKRLWYYLWVFTPRFEEAFPLSSTALVWWRSTWHKYKLFYRRFIYIAGVTFLPIGFGYKILLVCVILPLIVGAGFEITKKLKKL